MNPTYEVTAARHSRWWVIEVPYLAAVHSQARRLDQVESMAREAIEFHLQARGDSFDVTVTIDTASLGSLETTIEDAMRARKAAEHAQQQASAALRRAVLDIRNAGFTARDAGMLLGLSNQRISQIERQATESRSRGPRRATIGELDS